MKCLLCQKILKNKKSIKRSVGPICFKKNQDDKQLKIFPILAIRRYP